METIKKVIDTATTAVIGDAKERDLGQFRVKDTMEGNLMNTDFGVKIDDTDNSLKGGERGPLLMEDFHFREKMTHFDHERIPERVVHARGSGAHGYFELYESLEEYTRADFLCKTNKKTPLFVRFSTVLGSRGNADCQRDVRGFAIKFYTDEGNFDLVGNNIPVFFVQDAIKFVDVIHAGKPEPHNEIPQGQTAHDNFWDFISLTPESAHMIMWVLSDRAIPRSYGMMQGFGVHSFVFVNKKGKRSFVKFHIVPVLGVHSLAWDECTKINGQDPDFHRRDLYETINSGGTFEYELGVQIVAEEDEHKFDFDLLDATKIIPEELVPVRMIGKIVLNRAPDNFFAEVEQVAFHTGHLVPGIEPSNDPLLQGRNFSYVDTQLTRLGGPNFEEIPINRPICPVTNFNQDGFHRTKINANKINYFPNRLGCPGMSKLEGYHHSATELHGKVIRARGPKFYEFYNQARMFYISLADYERDHLTKAAIFELGRCDDVGVRQRMVDLFNKIDFDLAKNVAAGIGVQPPTESKTVSYNTKSPHVSQTIPRHNPQNSIKNRKIAILLADGFKAEQYTAIKSALIGRGATPVVVGPHKGHIQSDTQGVTAEAQFAFTTVRSVIFDAFVIPGGKASIEAMSNCGDAMGFIPEAFKHFKAIGALDEAVDYLNSFKLPGVEVATSNDTVVSSKGIVTLRNFTEAAAKMTGEGPLTFGKSLFHAIASHRHWDRDTKKVMA